jgi:hypothetical protein
MKQAQISTTNVVLVHGGFVDGSIAAPASLSAKIVKNATLKVYKGAPHIPRRLS